MHRKLLVLLGVGVISLLGFASARALQKPDLSRLDSELQVLDSHGKGGCGKYGTSVQFLSSPSEAARKAKQEEKLVFVLHVSGHFEDPKFT